MKKILVFLTVIAFSYGFAQVPAYVPTLGLVAHYPFSGNANDVSGNNHIGTASNVTLTTDRFSNANSAYVFNGSSSVIQLNTTNTVSFQTGVTYCAWVSASGFTNSSVVDDMDGVLNPNIGFRLCARSLSSPTPVVASNSGWYGSGNAAYSTSQYSLNTWSFIAASWGTDDSLRVYFNGIQQQAIYSAYTYTNTLPIYIGRGRLNSGYEVFNGKIDEVSIFNRVLTKCEMYGMYTGTVVAMNISGVSNSICVGTTMTLNATGLNTYSWTNIGTTNQIIVTPTANISYSVAGTHALTGCRVNSVIPVVINSLPTITVVGSNAICFGNTTTLSALGANTYTWSNGANSNIISVSPTINITYSVIGTDVNGCINSSSKGVTINPLPILATTGASTICVGNSASLTVSGANTYTWNTGSNSNNISVSPTVNVTYSVTGADLNGCVNFSTKSITVNPLPVLTIAGSNSICTGNTLTFTVSGASSYTWNNGSNSNNVTVSPISNASYTVVGIDLNGCMNSASKSITVYALPTLTISGTNTICIGNTTNLSVSGASTFSWSNGSTSSSISINPLVNTNYSVIGINSNGCSNNSNLLVTVNPLPTLSIGGANAVCQGSSTSFSVTGALSYTWNTGSGSNIISVSPTVNTTYSVSGTSSLGCKNSAAKSITVNPLPILIATSTKGIICAGETCNLSVAGASSYTWNNNQTASTIVISPTITSTYTVTGIDANGCSNSTNITQSVSACTELISNAQSANSQVLVFPNPNTGNFKVSSDIDVDIEILNEMGQLIKSIKLNLSNNRQFEITDFKSGIYFILYNNGSLVRNKIVINP